MTEKMVGRHHRLNGHEFEQLQEMVKDREAWRAAVHAVTKSWTHLSNRTITAAMCSTRWWRLNSDKNRHGEVVKELTV